MATMEDYTSHRWIVTDWICIPDDNDPVASNLFGFADDGFISVITITQVGEQMCNLNWLNEQGQPSWISNVPLSGGMLQAGSATVYEGGAASLPYPVEFPLDVEVGTLSGRLNPDRTVDGNTGTFVASADSSVEG